MPRPPQELAYPGVAYPAQNPAARPVIGPIPPGPVPSPLGILFLLHVQRLQNQWACPCYRCRRPPRRPPRRPVPCPIPALVPRPLPTVSGCDAPRLGRCKIRRMPLPIHEPNPRPVKGPWPAGPVLSPLGIIHLAFGTSGTHSLHMHTTTSEARYQPAGAHSSPHGHWNVRSNRYGSVQRDNATFPAGNTGDRAETAA